MSLWSRLTNIFRTDRLRAELDEELSSHLRQAVEEGRDPAEALQAFGSLLRYQEETRDTHIFVWLDSLRADVVFGWRQLVKNRVTSIVAVLSLGLAIGASTSAFRFIDALLWRPMPMHALLAAQVAFCFVVHFGASLFVSTLQKLSRQPTGFQPSASCCSTP